MAISVLTTEAIEQSTYVLTLSFTDEDADPIIPTAIVWTLTDLAGTVINDREQVVVASPAASADVVLQGADLQILTAEASRPTVKRRFIVEATYDSDLGTGLPLNDSCEFTLRNLKYVS